MSLTTAERREQFRRLVRAWRKNADLSTAELGALVNVTSEAVTQWETRGSMPRKRATAEALETAVGAPAGTFTALTHPRLDTTPPAPTDGAEPPTWDTVLAKLDELTAKVERVEVELAAERSRRQPQPRARPVRQSGAATQPR